MHACTETSYFQLTYVDGRTICQPHHHRRHHNRHIHHQPQHPPSPTLRTPLKILGGPGLLSSCMEPLELTVGVGRHMLCFLLTHVWGHSPPPSPQAPLLVVSGGPGLPSSYMEPLELMAGVGRQVIFYDQVGPEMVTDTYQ
jgi:hypothetical protein